jgi:alpha-D-ribose 1-methylphosphonate 5-triphosphate synthase subunit PhnI
VTVELARLGAQDRDFDRLAVAELTGGRSAAIAIQRAYGTAVIELGMDPYETVVLHLKRATK